MRPALQPEPRPNDLATHQELSDFLESIERRAFKQAVFAVHNDETALDIVQDAMLRLAEKYGDRPPEELPLLFQRIMQNAIRDYFRRSKVRSTWMTLLSALAPDDEDPHGYLDTLEIEDPAQASPNPEHQFSQAQTIGLIEKELERLPPRQREAFIMRYWLEMDVAETAAAMGCTEGSVKTHCSRATHTLANVLKNKGITL
jgi:RNA polymerase sigma-70 factor (ECF subfamily)